MSDHDPICELAGGVCICNAVRDVMRHARTMERERIAQAIDTVYERFRVEYRRKEDTNQPIVMGPATTLTIIAECARIARGAPRWRGEPYVYDDPARPAEAIQHPIEANREDP